MEIDDGGVAACCGVAARASARARAAAPARAAAAAAWHGGMAWRRPVGLTLTGGRVFLSIFLSFVHNANGHVQIVAPARPFLSSLLPFSFYLFHLLYIFLLCMYMAYIFLYIYQSIVSTSTCMYTTRRRAFAPFSLCMPAVCRPARWLSSGWSVWCLLHAFCYIIYLSSRVAI